MTSGYDLLVGQVFEHARDVGTTAIRLHTAMLSQHVETMQHIAEDIEREAQRAAILAGALATVIAKHRQRNARVAS